MIIFFSLWKATHDNLIERCMKGKKEHESMFLPLFFKKKLRTLEAMCNIWLASQDKLVSPIDMPNAMGISHMGIIDRISFISCTCVRVANCHLFNFSSSKAVPSARCLIIAALSRNLQNITDQLASHEQKILLHAHVYEKQSQWLYACY